MWLFFLAGFHAYVVFGLACLCGVIFRTRLLLISTLLTSARLRSCCSGDAANAEHHNDNRSDRSHDDLLLGNLSLIGVQRRVRQTAPRRPPTPHPPCLPAPPP